jgi:hypothetical protein
MLLPSITNVKAKELSSGFLNLGLLATAIHSLLVLLLGCGETSIFNCQLFAGEL